jgi:hypothetical protein
MKFGDIVPSKPGIRTFRVEAKAASPRQMANCRRLAEDHDPAANSKIVVPDAITRAMYALAALGTGCSL